MWNAEKVRRSDELAGVLAGDRGGQRQEICRETDRAQDQATKEIERARVLFGRRILLP